MPKCPRPSTALLIAFALCAAAPLYAATAAKPAAKPGDGSKGTAQMAGGSGKFGVTYTLTDHNGLLLNYTILSAAYMLEPGDYQKSSCYAPNSTQKMLEIHYKVKNPQSADMYYNGNDYLQVVDSQDKIDTTVDGQGRDVAADTPSAGTLKPGQGIDDLVTYALVPRAGGVSKLILTLGRNGVDEKVLRFPIGTAPNTIKALPAPYADLADPTGATAFANISAKYDTAYASGFYTMAVSPGVSVTGNLGDDAPGDKNKFVTFLVKLTNVSEGQIYVSDDGNVDGTLTDADGDSIKATGTTYKPLHDDHTEGRQVEAGTSISFRLAFQIPSDETLTTLKVDSAIDNSGHVSESLTYDASGVK